MKKLIPISFYLGSLWNLLIVTLVVLGSEWALPRAAGGQFESFPTWLRVLYLFNAALISFQVYVYASQKANFFTFFFYLNLASATVNILSRSPLERWNAVAAFTIAYAFWCKRID